MLADATASFMEGNAVMADELRLSTLARIQIMESDPEPEFDDIIELAASITNSPIASIAFIDDKRSWIKAKVGLDVTELPRERTICDLTVGTGECVVIEDSLADDRVRDNPWVNGEEASIRFYAGIPIRMPNGATVGSLCVAGHEPRALSPHERTCLEKLVRVTVALLAKR